MVAFMVLANTLRYVTKQLHKPRDTALSPWAWQYNGWMRGYCASFQLCPSVNL